MDKVPGMLYYVGLVDFLTKEHLTKHCLQACLFLKKKYWKAHFVY